MAALPFDRIVVQHGGVRRDLTVSGFLSLPLPDRVSLILARAVEFYLGAALVDRQEALRHLRAYRPG